MILEYHKIDTPESPLDPHAGELPARPAAPLGARLPDGRRSMTISTARSPCPRAPRRVDPDLRRLLAGPVPLYPARQRLGHRSRVRGSASWKPSRASIRASATRPRSTCCRAPTRPTGSSTSPTWPTRKLQYLVSRGYEIGNHSLWHAELGRYSEAVVREQLAGAQEWVQRHVPGYRFRTLALPLGSLPQGARLGAGGRGQGHGVQARRHPDGGGRRGPVAARAELRPNRLPRIQAVGATSTTGSPTSTRTPASAT